MERGQRVVGEEGGRGCRVAEKWRVHRWRDVHKVRGTNEEEEEKRGVEVQSSINKSLKRAGVGGRRTQTPLRECAFSHF